MASSKSFASTGSMVNVSKALQSLRLATSASSIISTNLPASSTTSSEKLNGNPASAKISFIAASFTSSGAITLMTSPTGFLSSLSQRTNFTNTLSLCCAPLIDCMGIYKSGIGLSESGTKKAWCADTCNLPMNSVCFRSTTSVIFPSFLPVLTFSRITLTLTVSPFSAVPKSLGLTNTSPDWSSINTYPIPERVTSSFPFKV